MLRCRMKPFVAITLAVGLAAPAQAAEDFYKGKQLRLIVSVDAGTAYDIYARVLASTLPAHIPGRPTIVVQNMAGSSGLTATGYMANVAPRDGTVIAGVLSHIPTASLLSRQGVQFDSTKLSWIGSITSDPYVGYVWHTSPVKSMAEAKTRQVIMGGGGVGSASVDYAVIAKELLGFKFKIVTGYRSSVDTKLAIERQEIDGTFGNGWTSLKTAEPDWLKEKKITIITQFGFKRTADLPDVPLFIDFAEKAQDRQLLELMLARQEFSKPYFAPPDVPADRLAILRRAFDDTMKDPEFQAAARKANLALDGPMTGEELSALTNKLAATPPSVVKYMEDTFAKFIAENK